MLRNISWNKLHYLSVWFAGDFTVDHPTIESFWRVVHEFTPVQRSALLKFVTSCSRPPLLGFKVSSLSLRLRNIERLEKTRAEVFLPPPSLPSSKLNLLDIVFFPTSIQVNIAKALSFQWNCERVFFPRRWQFCLLKISVTKSLATKFLVNE